MLIRATALGAITLALVACAPLAGPDGIPRAILGDSIAISTGLVGATRPDVAPTPPDPAERALATAILRDLQHRSFAENREYCGYIVRDAAGRLLTGPINAGVEAACPLPRVPGHLALVASFHTHSTYSPYFQSEFPTVQDMLTDAATGINGFIATPGGRLWYVDGRALAVTQLCGRGCLPQDPNYDPSDDGEVRPSYTLDELRRRERF